MDYKKILRSLVLGLGMVLVMGGAAYALTTVTGHLKFDGTVPGAIEKITFGTTGSSAIYDDWHLHIATDDYLYLDAQTVIIGNGRAPGLAEDIRLGNTGSSRIYDDWHLHIATDDYLYLDAPLTTYISNDMDVAGNLIVDGTITGTTIVDSTTATTFTFGYGSDAEVQDMLLKLGSVNPATLAWDGSASTLSFTDNVAITGTLGVTGQTTLTGALTGGVATFKGNVALGDASTDTTTILGATTITDGTVLNDGNALSVYGTLYTSGTGSERGIAAEFVSNVGSAVAITGANSGVSMFTYIDDSGATLPGGLYGLFVGVEEDNPRGEPKTGVDADLQGGGVYLLSLYHEFSTTTPPDAIYPFKINFKPGGEPATGFMFIPEKDAVGLVDDVNAGTADAYLKIVTQGGEVYRILLNKE